MSKIIDLVFSILLTGFGSVGLANQLREAVRGWSSKRWPSAEATVTSSVVCERLGSRGRTMLEPTIEYRYIFDGVEHVGHRIRFGGVATRNRAIAEEVSARFSSGTVWSVSVCPKRPGQAVLHPGISGELWWALCFFLVYTGLAIAFLVDAVGQVGR